MGILKKTATELKKTIQGSYKSQHEYRAVKASNFGHLDLDYYNTVRDDMVRRGCKLIGDFEIVTLKGTPNDPMTFLRVLISANQLTSVCLFHHPMSGKAGRIIDCETELGRDGYLITSNAKAAGKLDAPPNFDVKWLSASTLPEKVFTTHQTRLKNFMAKNPEAEITRLKGRADVFRMQARMHAAKAAYRKQVGLLSQEELQRFGLDSDTAEALSRLIRGAS